MFHLLKMLSLLKMSKIIGQYTIQDFVSNDETEYFLRLEWCITLIVRLGGMGQQDMMLPAFITVGGRGGSAGAVKETKSRQEL
jgi:hypothetical protein